MPCVPCPDCNRRMVSNGRRSRWFYGRLCLVIVVTCTHCRRYDRLLPDDMCAWRDATLDQVEAALLAGPGHVAGARASGQVGSGAARRVRRWARGLAAIPLPHVRGLRG